MTFKAKTFWLLSIFICAFFIDQETVFGYDVQANVANRSKQDILLKWEQYKPMGADDGYMNPADIYEQQPSTKAPFALGKIKQAYIFDGINATNFMRYLAGLPDDIEPDWMLASQQQAAALMNAVNNQLSHHPTKPDDMDEELYKLGLKGASTSNLYAVSPTFYHNVLGYMADSGASNIDKVGHRRWILNPAMKKTMFGMVFITNEKGNEIPYSSMYALNKDRAKGEVNYRYVSWPSAGFFPAEVFSANHPWSVTLNSEIYDNTKIQEIKVTLTRSRDGKTWRFDHKDKNKEGKYFNVETSNFGEPFSIIFRPDGVDRIEKDDSFLVHISGIYDKNGNAAEIAFETKFFVMEATAAP